MSEGSDGGLDIEGTKDMTRNRSSSVRWMVVVVAVFALVAVACSKQAGGPRREAP